MRNRCRVTKYFRCLLDLLGVTGCVSDPEGQTLGHHGIEADEFAGLMAKAATGLIPGPDPDGIIATLPQSGQDRGT